MLTRRMILPLLFGLCGAAILVGLGVWQLQRLEWKRGILAEITAKIGAEPIALPAQPEKSTDIYLPVRVTGSLTGAEAHVLTSQREEGPGYRIIAAFQTEDGRNIMMDLGFVAEADLATPRPTGPMSIIGNLHWPDEVDSFTPPYDAARKIWFARDVAPLAAALGTEPLLVIVRQADPEIAKVKTLPVDTLGIANDHMEYAITWFSLAIVWLGMTALLLWRIRRRTD